MKTKLLKFASAVVIMVASASAYAEHTDSWMSNWYLSGTGAVNFAQKTDIKDTAPAVTDVKMKTGYFASGALGYAWNDWRFEAEFGFRRNRLDEANVGGAKTALTGNISYFTIMGNLFYDLPINDMFAWYLGAGIGWARAIAVIDQRNDDAKDNVFAYQFMTGPIWHITEHLHASVGYRLFSTTDIDTNATPKTKIKAVLNHDIEFGLRYVF